MSCLLKVFHKEFRSSSQTFKIFTQLTLPVRQLLAADLFPPRVNYVQKSGPMAVYGTVRPISGLQSRQLDRPGFRRQRLWLLRWCGVFRWDDSSRRDWSADVMF
ncbi:unnamed protein product [Toxocara canis]|uniref:Uncharacterized protein n=1 Tax=Toxocara canis TaxID=6265 RepID=A0A183V2F4_TOXCA|nr:unnamed protein product [Toxocara canis]